MKIKSYKNLCSEAMETFRMIISFADSVCVCVCQYRFRKMYWKEMCKNDDIGTGLHITQFTFYV